jgi:AraC family ethanolamine operon transcriptional activator
MMAVRLRGDSAERILMSYQRDTFEDFHVHGASAPEWEQRYIQLSCGRMRSRLVEVTTDGLHVFRKWMSERVAQDGCLPPGKICFATLPRPIGETPRLQGRDLLDNSLFVLRGGDHFTLQRPKGMELLAVTFEMEEFRRLCDESPWSTGARALLSRTALESDGEQLARLRMLLGEMFRDAAGAQAADPGAMASARAFHVVAELFESAAEARQPVASASASAIVARCHQLTATSGDTPPSIAELCARLRTSRRTLQNSFRAVADTTPVHYLRSIRLAAVRTQLLSSRAESLSVTQAALAHGFTHLGHFSSNYKALFGESPSDSAHRSDARRSR